MGISESRFNMWRAVAAVMHADEIVQPHEINFILESTKNIALSDEQRAQLIEDLRTPGDIEACFRKITIPRDKEDFFYLAQAIAWSDGDFDEREQALLAKIRMLPTAIADTELLKNALSHFQDIYIEGTEAPPDQSMFSLIRGILNKKAA